MLENRYRGNRIHPVCYGQPYKINRISYYPPVTLGSNAGYQKKRFPLTDMVLAKQEELACSQKVGHITVYFPKRSLMVSELPRDHTCSSSLLVRVFKHTKLNANIKQPVLRMSKINLATISIEGKVKRISDGATSMYPTYANTIVKILRSWVKPNLTRYIKCSQ